MGVNGCNKGKTFERYVAKFLTERTGVEFFRTANSGAYATIHKGKSLAVDGQRGDVTYDHNLLKNWYTNIECKSYKNLNIMYDMQNAKSDIRKWIDKLDKEGKEDWLLIVKSNQRPIMYFTRSLRSGKLANNRVVELHKGIFCGRFTINGFEEIDFGLLENLCIVNEEG
jgi:Holliday junction resolvase